MGISGLFPSWEVPVHAQIPYAELSKWGYFQNMTPEAETRNIFRKKVDGATDSGISIFKSLPNKKILDQSNLRACAFFSSMFLFCWKVAFYHWLTLITEISYFHIGQ